MNDNTAIVKIKSHRYLAFSLVEVLLSIALFSLIVTLLIGMLVYIQDSNIASANLEEAAILSEEGIEIAYDIRNQNFQNLTDGNHGTAIVAGVYEFQNDSDSIEDFTRVISVDSTGLDTYTKRITSTVIWQNRVGGNRSVQTEVLITDWRRQIANVVPWVAPQIEAVFNVNSNSEGRDVLIDGNYIYFLSANQREFSVYDRSVQGVISFVTDINLQSGPKMMVQNGSYVYIASAANNQSFIVIDVSDPTNASLLTAEKISGNIPSESLEISSNVLYVLRDYPATSLPTKKIDAGDYSIASFDVSNPATPTHLGGAIINDGALSDLIIDGNYMYVAGGTDSSEIYVFDLTNTASNPTQVATLDLSGSANVLSLEIKDYYLFAGKDDGTISTVDITNPLSPSEIGTFTLGDDINEMVTSGDYMFVASATLTTEFAILNITDPINISLHGSADMTDIAWGIAYDPILDRAYVANSDSAQELIIFAPE